MTKQIEEILLEKGMKQPIKSLLRCFGNKYTPKQLKNATPEELNAIYEEWRQRESDTRKNLRKQKRMDKNHVQSNKTKKKKINKSKTPAAGDGDEEENKKREIAAQALIDMVNMSNVITNVSDAPSNDMDIGSIASDGTLIYTDLDDEPIIDEEMDDEPIIDEEMDDEPIIDKEMDDDKMHAIMRRNQLLELRERKRHAVLRRQEIADEKIQKEQDDKLEEENKEREKKEKNEQLKHDRVERMMKRRKYTDKCSLQSCGGSRKTIRRRKKNKKKTNKKN